MVRSHRRLVLALGLCFAATALAACAGGSQQTKPSQVVKNDEGEVLICHEEFPTGSHIGRTVCRTEEDQETERLKARDFVTAPRPVRQVRPEAPPTGR